MFDWVGGRARQILLGTVLVTAGLGLVMARPNPATFVCLLVGGCGGALMLLNAML